MGWYGKNQAHIVRTFLGKPSSREESGLAPDQWLAQPLLLALPRQILPFPYCLSKRSSIFFPLNSFPASWISLWLSTLEFFACLYLRSKAMKRLWHILPFCPGRLRAEGTPKLPESKALHDFLMCGLVREKSVCVHKTVVLCWMTPTNGSQSPCHPVVWNPQRTSVKALGLEPKKALEMEVVADSIVWVMESSLESGIFCCCCFALFLCICSPTVSNTYVVWFWRSYSRHLLWCAEVLLSQEPKVPLHICHI